MSKSRQGERAVVIRSFRLPLKEHNGDLQCVFLCEFGYHHNDVIMSVMVSQITSLTIVSSTIYSSAEQRKHQSSASVAFVRWIHRWPVHSPHKGPVTRKMFPFDDVIMIILWVIFTIYPPKTNMVQLWCVGWNYLLYSAILQTQFSNAFCKTFFDILMKISMKFVLWGTINDESTLVQVTAWHRTGEPTTPICVPKLQCVVNRRVWVTYT